MLCIVIGAGIVGLHVAHALREKGHEVFVLEQSPYLGDHTSGRNSGVIHAGIFYSHGSFKEKICIEGNRLTYEWLRRLDVSHRPCGKWIVPEPGQEGDLEPFFERVRKLPIATPQWKKVEEVQREEPNLRPSPAVLIPSTGILDAAAYVNAMASFLEGEGGQVIRNCHVMGVQGQELETTRGPIAFDLAINSAGLFADELAVSSGLVGDEVKPCRGDYYIVAKKLLSRPVYHLPYQGAHGLGVHLTPTVDDQLLAGPNAFFIERKDDYEHRSSPEAYQRAVDYFLPEVGPVTLQPAYSGNRPKLFKEGKALPEFEIVKKGAWIHLLGIESPGLTGAPALARHVMGLI